MKRPAFSLIEILVVLAIVAVLIGMGVVTLIGLRNRTLAKQAVDEFILNVNTLKNTARNSVVSDRPSGFNVGIDDDVIVADKISKLDFYAMAFREGEYYQGECSDETTFLTCQFQPGSMKSSSLTLIDMNPDDEQQCTAIIFSPTTGKFSFGKVDGNNLSLDTKGICTFNFVHKQSPDIRFRVAVDKEKNDIYLYNGEVQ
jgi:prepilin-type N-terminal cleavage/methylation domain-containing protein